MKTYEHEIYTNKMQIIQLVFYVGFFSSFFLLLFH